MENITTAKKIERLKVLWDEDKSTLEEVILMSELCMEWKIDWRKYSITYEYASIGGAMFAALCEYSNEVYQKSRGRENPLGG